MFWGYKVSKLGHLYLAITLQCFKSHQWRQREVDVPGKKVREHDIKPTLPPQKVSFQKCKKSQSKESTQAPPKDAKVNHISIKEEMEEQAQIYASLDSSGCNWNYSILEDQVDYEAKYLTFLIDSGSSHSFMSPSSAKDWK